MTDIQQAALDAAKDIKGCDEYLEMRDTLNIPMPDDIGTGVDCFIRGARWMEAKMKKQIQDDAELLIDTEHKASEDL